MEYAGAYGSKVRSLSRFCFMVIHIEHDPVAFDAVDHDWSAEARAQADFEVNTRSEIEIETILLHLENQNRLIIEILHCMNKEKPS